MISQINHIGIAVKSLDEQIPLYRDILQLKLKETETIPAQKVKVAVFQIGAVNIELLQPTSAESPIAKFIEKNGPGLHHIALQTDDITKQLKRLQSAGLRLIDQQPRPGAQGTKIAFVHPKSTGKVLMELCQQI